MGMDFAGPFTIRRGHTRKPILEKAYCCLFVCMVCKAIHLERCATLDTEEFMAALSRFCNRRGTPLAIYSDNGSNFIGAKSELQSIQRLLSQTSDAISHFTTAKNIEWHNIPPRSPHHGGLWEARIREMKRLLRKMVTPHPLRHDELQTVLIEVEASFNSRPLVALGATEADMYLALTPGHFFNWQASESFTHQTCKFSSAAPSENLAIGSDSSKISGMHGEDTTSNIYRPDGSGKEQAAHL